MRRLVNGSMVLLLRCLRTRAPIRTRRGSVCRGRSRGSDVDESPVGRLHCRGRSCLVLALVHLVVRVERVIFEVAKLKPKLKRDLKVGWVGEVREVYLQMDNEDW